MVPSFNSGYSFQAELHCGADTKLSDTGLGQGADVVLGLIKNAFCQVVPLLPLTTILPLFLCLMSFQNGALEVWALFGKIAWKMQQFH